MEWIMPVLYEKNPVAILFAAGNRPPKVIPDGIPVLRASEGISEADLGNEKETSVEELEMVMEALRQLASRLTLWFQQAQEKGPELNGLGREDIIQTFFQERFLLSPTLKDLADLLFLSPSRTAHLVREKTGFCFSELLIRTRLIQSERLLRETDLPISAVSRKSGFGNPSHFFRAFRKHFQMTPAEYRKMKESGRENGTDLNF